MKAILIFFVCLFVYAALVWYCAREAELCGGYFLFKCNGAQIILSNRTDHPDLHGLVKKIAVIKPYVTGYHVPDPNYDGQKTIGYFILNTKTHDLNCRMSKEEWIAKLKQIGLSKPFLRDASTYPLY